MCTKMSYPLALAGILTIIVMFPKHEQNLQMNTDAFLVSVFERAVKESASDIHFERFGDAFLIRFRVDGVLQERWRLPAGDIEQVINSLKVIASLDITNHETPQDGHFEFIQTNSGGVINANIAGQPIDARIQTAPNIETGVNEDREKKTLDVRISVYPSIKGEVVVARLLNRQHALMPISELGMDQETLEKVKHIISREYGMILITGPVGSGKTTTLYSLMLELRDDERIIMTIEDPVEFHLEWLRQSELRPSRGFGFHEALRSILRQDPDVLMIGEIRDPETAEHAISVSLVGRIVGSTIHSNSNVGTIARLIDLNIERGMIAYAINGVISQRLVRKVCASCAENYTPEQSQLDYFGITRNAGQFVRGKGCEACHGTGYSGRTGIFEVLTFDSGIRSLIVDKVPMEAIEEYAAKTGTKTLKQDALEKVLAGVTTIEEVMKFV